MPQDETATNYALGVLNEAENYIESAKSKIEKGEDPNNDLTHAIKILEVEREYFAS